MFRASKTLLCALAADVSLASRQTGTVVNVLDSIGSLLQTHEASASGAVHSRVMNNLRVLASITPDQKASLEDALGKVIFEIDKNVLPKIEGGLADTADAISTTISELTEATNRAVQHKIEAVDADSAWFACIRKEKGDLEAIETSTKELQTSRSSDVATCQIQQDLLAVGFSATPQLPDFDCDFSLTDNCDDQVSNYRKTVGDMVSALHSDMTESQSKYTDAKNKCADATDKTAAQSNAHDTLKEVWNVQRRECQESHESRLLRMCSFGTELQRKCMKATAYTTLIDEVEKVNGGEHSQPDREQEWHTTQITKCMINAIIAGGEIDAKALDDCDKLVTSVGELDRQETAFADRMTAEKFTCSEKDTAITFKGETWDVPEGEVDELASEQYKPISDYAPEVTLTENASPFTFCRGK